MRPEISEPLKFIYPNLKNHETVYDFPHIKGTNNKNYFFMDHKFLETKNDFTKSKSNIEEAELIIRFSNYLLK